MLTDLTSFQTTEQQLAIFFYPLSTIHHPRSTISPMTTLPFEIPDLERELRGLLTQIPSGKVATCGMLAQALGSSMAAKWIGHFALHHRHDDACNCHRIVRAGGELGGYVSGKPEEKIRRLKREGVVLRQGIDRSRPIWLFRVRKRLSARQIAGDSRRTRPQDFTTPAKTNAEIRRRRRCGLSGGRGRPSGLRPGGNGHWAVGLVAYRAAARAVSVHNELFEFPRTADPAGTPRGSPRRRKNGRGAFGRWQRNLASAACRRGLAFRRGGR